MTADRASDVALERRLERLGLTGKEDSWTDRYLLCEHLIDPATALPRQRFEAIARFIRDLIAHRWVKTRQVRENANPKRIYYLSMEFLIGRMLNNNMMNLAADAIVQRAMQHEGWNFSELLEEEPDAGLGNGGLGRLAACFLDSLATLQYSAIGYGLRYEYGIFRQTIRNGYQIEEPDKWLRHRDPWEIGRPGKLYPVRLNASIDLQGSAINIITMLLRYRTAVPFVNRSTRPCYEPFISQYGKKHLSAIWGLIVRIHKAYLRTRSPSCPNANPGDCALDAISVCKAEQHERMRYLAHCRVKHQPSYHLNE
jgi:starch phosphorylase